MKCELMNCKGEIRKFVLSNLLFDSGGNLQDDMSFLDSGAVDSAGILEIIMFLETTFEITIEPEETVPENLDSVNRIADFLNRKLSMPLNQ